MAEVLDFMIKMNMMMGGNLPAQVAPATQKLSQLSQALQKLSQTGSKISAFQKQAANLDTLRKKLELTRSKVRDMQTIMRTGGKVDSRLFTKANEDAAKLQRQVMENTKKLGEFRAQLKEAGVDTNDLAGAQAKLQAQTERMTQAQERLSRAQTRYSDLQSKLSWGNFQGDIMKSAALVKTFQKPIKVNMDFEQAMANTKAAAMPSPEEFKQLEIQAKALGRSTQFSATQAANSQEILMRAGLNTQQVLENLPTVLNVAAAEGIGIAEAADMLVNATGGMKYDVSMMPIVGDVLAFTSSHANTNIPQLAEAMQIAAPAASDIGMSVEQLASILGAMSTTVRGSQAGTAIASTISRLAKAPKQVTNALDKLGIARFTRNGEFVEIPVLIEQIEQKLSSMGKGQAEAYRSQIYGQFAPQMSGLYANIANGMQARLELGAYTQRDGAAQQMSQIRNETLQGKITSLSSAWEGLMIKIGEALTPINAFVVETLTTGISKLTDFLETHKKWADIVTRIGYGYAAWKIGSTVFKYASIIAKLPGAYLETLSAAKAATQSVPIISSMIGKIAGAFSWLGGLIMAHPLVALATLIAAGVVAIIMNWDKLKKWWNDFVIPNVWEPLKTKAIELIDNLKTLWDDFKTWITDKFANFNPFNWKLPEFLGGGTIGSNKQQVSNAEAALSGWMPQPIKHATGGILTQPHLGLVAEAGPEAIIPLTDKSRGISLLMKAADILGLNLENNNPLASTSNSLSSATSSFTSSSLSNALTSSSLSNALTSNSALSNILNASTSGVSSSAEANFSKNLTEVMNYANNSVFPAGSSVSTNNTHTANWPQINLTVNVSSPEGQSPQAQAESIADKIRDVLRDIFNNEERLAFD